MARFRVVEGSDDLRAVAETISSTQRTSDSRRGVASQREPCLRLRALRAPCVQIPMRRESDEVQPPQRRAFRDSWTAGRLPLPRSYFWRDLFRIRMRSIQEGHAAQWRLVAPALL